VGAECAAAGGHSCDERVGVHLQVQHRVAQGSQRRRFRWRGVGFYFRNVTELILFGVRGKNARTLAPGRRQVNFLATRKREHSRKPDEQYDVIEACSPGPFLELFGRGRRAGWVTWGNQADDSYRPTWKTYANHSMASIDGVAEKVDLLPGGCGDNSSEVRMPIGNLGSARVKGGSTSPSPRHQSSAMAGRLE